MAPEATATDAELEQAAEVIANTKLITDHLLEVIRDVERETPIRGLPIFIGLLAVATTYAAHVINSVPPDPQRLDKQQYIAAQLAARALKVADVILDMPQGEQSHDPE